MQDLPIVFSEHAKESMQKRGATPQEVEQAIRGTLWTEAKTGRRETKLELPFKTEWNKKFYKTKQVNPVFTVEDNTIVVITVYVFYF